ncbi:hypothetical protein [Streptomyces sp. TP-A0356]|uniref:hypothetical protein n=1 Tax=Streptomyces sp. TP-A0356 TaxID=1359208 RepID=UPI00131E757E|nr:hypothetical protein [Streptomyces sp. TP-A0356]
MPDNGVADDLPEWRMPPRLIGGYVTGPVLIGRSDGFVVAVRQVLAYPVGVEIEVEAHTRGSSPGGMPPVAVGPWYPQPCFRVRFADGREAAQDDETGLRGGRGPMLVVSKSEYGSSGPDDREDMRLTLWIWPLPPPGPLTVTCAWPQRGFQDASLVLDADAIQAAAGQAQPFWPEPSP